METERTAGTEYPAVSRPDPDRRPEAGPSAASEEPTLPVAAVARRLGVAPATLRTWDRRYGLGPGGHTNGKHRRYGPIDIARLEVMQRALLSGAATAEAAQYALDSVKQDDPAPLDLNGAVPSQPTSRDAPFVGETRSALGPSRLARRLSAAALAMDSRMVRQLLAEAIATDGPVAAWEQVISPVLSAVGAGWRGSRSGPEAEFLLTEFTFGALARATPVVERPRNHHPVMLACPAPERGSLALYALTAALAERQIDALVFGTSLPADVLVATARRTVPAAIVLWTQRPDSASPALFSRLARGKQRSRLFACGPGWCRDDLPGTVEWLGGMSSAVERISYVLLGRS
ncbi:MAG: MerR family transcriptional regulator [Actinophytocola sp.]|nr:MerR family transcriptional regulator [Actinophytocola sp.]